MKCIIVPHARSSDKSFLSLENDKQCWHFTGGSYLKTELWKSVNGKSGGPTLNRRRHFDATPLKDDQGTHSITESHNGETLGKRERSDPGQLGESGEEQGATWNCSVHKVTYQSCILFCTKGYCYLI